MIETTFDAKVINTRVIKGQDGEERTSISAIALGLKNNGFDGEVEKLRLHLHVFFPRTFRGVDELKGGEIVRLSGRITTYHATHLPADPEVTIVTMTIHGYSIVTTNGNAINGD
jgi:hypothetical protein